MNTPNRIHAHDLRRALAASKSVARHGRATPEIKAARALLKRLLEQVNAAGNGPDRPSDETLLEAIRAHDAAMTAAGLNPYPPVGPMND